MARNVKNLLKRLVFVMCHIIVIYLPITMTAQTDCMLPIKFEKDSNHTATYEELRSFFNNAAQCSGKARYETFGDSDSGQPLNVFILDVKSEFVPRDEKDKRAVILINNGIHPGEPCGIEACMMLVRDMLKEGKSEELLDDVIILIVPIYNIGGMLNRNSHTRANQNGPAAYGFRGNAKNLDLNRDFIKADSRNARSMIKLINRWNPDIFIDTHTSNGADYQYTMTLIANMKDRLAPSLQELVYDDMLPTVYDEMAAAGWEMVPYVNVRTTPESGIAAFNDLGRYSTGYGALHHIPGFTTEAHMLKPYVDRVHATRAYLDIMLAYTAANKQIIKESREAAIAHYQNLKSASLKWQLNAENVEMLNFKGYEAKMIPSDVTGADRLSYDHQNPYEKEVPYLSEYKSIMSVDVPKSYVLPQAYQNIADLLRLNGVVMKRSRMDSTSKSASYRISEYNTTPTAYEGHFLHSDVEVVEHEREFQIRRGDYIIETDQKARRFIVETLEPQAPDSYFAWNYFDGILMQKEHFSPYIFEDTAAQLLKDNPKLKEAFESKKQTDQEFAADWFAQLNYLYKQSPNYETTVNLYPVGRIF